MAPFRVIIVGAGPAGLATALALAQKSRPESPVDITLLELRDKMQETLGGAVNLTPLALRYLDSLGVGARLRRLASPVAAIELVSHRTGGLLGRLWPDVDAIRVQRHLLVSTMLEALPSRVNVVFNARIRSVDDTPAAIRVSYVLGDSSSNSIMADADLLVGCDGLHSQVRSQYVDPGRTKTYSGKCNAYGYSSGRLQPSSTRRWLRADGRPLITDTVVVSKGNESLLLTYYTPAHDSLYLAAVMPLADEPAGRSREGWALCGADKARLKSDIDRAYAGGGLPCLPDILDRCHEWFFFPVYVLPPGGVWSRGRAVLLGDAAHGMPPQGESTGVAIEDGVLLAHVLSHRCSRSVPQLLDDYEKLRRADVDAVYRETMARWNMSVPSGWISGFLMEWLTWGYVKFLNINLDHFARDVRKFALPN